MSLDYLTMNIRYNIRKDKFEINGDVAPKGQYELVETFLRSQVGAGEDKSKLNRKEAYNIQFKWYPDRDLIEVSSDTGNKALRDGILLFLLGNLKKEGFA